MRDKDHDKSDHHKPEHDKHGAKPHKQDPLSQKNQEVEIAKDMINAYRKKYADIDPKVLFNLIELKQITQAPKQEQPDASYSAIKQRLGIDESQETLRQERWRQQVHCPACGSHRIRRILETEKDKLHGYKYQCQDCQKTFNDDTDTPIEKGVPPISTWMFCWYLLGCTDSIQYIATKLGLDLSTVELMVRQMQKLFKSQQPLTNLLTFDEWSLKHGKSYKERIKHEIAKKEELHRGENPNAPKDTAEYRRQKTRAREPKDHTPSRPKPKNRNI